ncbi:glycosyltransferase family 4 protein [Microbacterium oxydans]|uniref:D-inositol 3-phosphate glycosyltransferase n=1 Tax=Microbacterium oxydans TaxID=82380 RepID=A0A0F0LAJ2_9MICO|nr:glycosyltransferase family 4 protein [Microbacterium oxydans]KJL29300.1 D-inositol-3-phosphate glycosyltransferase [Microbacterium oxydans]
MSEALVYYFAFPHYRKGILDGLRSQPEPTFDLAAGSSSRANIKALGAEDIDGLEIVRSFRLGPVSWDRGVVRRASSRRYRTVVLGPATLSLSTWAILVARRLRGRRTFLWGQCGRFGDRSLKRRVQETMNRLATGLLVYGENEAVAATQLGLSPRRVTVINNATHSNRDVLDAQDHADQLARAKAAAASAEREGQLRLLFVGRLNQDKQLDVLLRAAAKLKAQYPGLVIDLIGDGDARTDLRDEFDHDWVRFHGWVYDTDELNEYFRAATFVCSPFHMGLLAIDALRAGTPVLVPDNPMNGSEVEALTPMVNAVRFPPGDEDGIVAAVGRWFSVVGDLEIDLYRQARTTALETWDPAGVAAAIKRATAERT